MKEYKTDQRKALYGIFSDNKGRKFSIDELIAELSPDCRISRSAVYRNVSRMVSDGMLRKTAAPEGRGTFYQYCPCESCCERIHLRCEKCGKIMHLESESAESALAALLEKNGFKLDGQATELVGICKDCK